MFHINLEFDDIKISSIEKEDLLGVYGWLQYEDNFIEYDDFYERFLEYYLNECEFFLKVYKDKDLIGIIKGKVEFKNPNEVWLVYFLIGSKARSKGLGSQILNYIINYFSKDCGIVRFYAKIQKTNFKTLGFWKENQFNPIKLLQGVDDKSIILVNCSDKI
ncbi:GNAT family N-acetyltransferase [Clostridium sp.]|jgi:GNAT superfamily N-acetyltransferase|uniref:GNAT family N-acetyltransferase n=1 Tax=Clostridium sp. TaxID=1506 RepID=UPI0039F4C022